MSKMQQAGAAGEFEPSIPEPGQQFSAQKDVPPGEAGRAQPKPKEEKKAQQPPQSQAAQPGRTAPMAPAPRDRAEGYLAAGKLAGRRALITGGDSGIGRSIAVHFAKEGADVAIAYLDEDDDARETMRLIEAEGVKCLTVAGDIGDPDFCRSLVEKCAKQLGGLDILVNNAAEQHEQERLEDITDEQLERTFRTNIFGMFYLTRAALPHLKRSGSGAVVNTASITAYQGHKTLLDYASTKAAIVGFTRSLAENLAESGVRVNAVAPGPIWTPLIPASFDADKVAEHGSDAPLGRVGQPDDVAPAFVYLASSDSAYVTGQTIHINGGTVVNG